LIAIDASAQVSSGAPWQRGTTLAGFAGAASTSATTPALGTALGWEIYPHLTVEGRGVWLPHDPAATDFFAWLGALVPLKPGATVVPFASAGVGMYRATVEAGVADVPEFYQRRMNNRQRAIFQDVALAFGGGADVFVTSHIAIRPEAGVLVVTTRSDARAGALYGVHVAYHFAAHKIR